MRDEAFDVRRSSREYTPAQRRVEAVGLVVFGLLAVAIVPRAAQALAGLNGWIAAAAVLLGVITADFVSGLVHWIGDTWGRESWPVVGNGLIRGFREHHADPRAITRHDGVETNGSAALGLLPVMVLALGLPAGGPTEKARVLFLVVLAVSLVATNQIHKWAHQDEPPRPVRVLQRLRLVLPPDHHAVHHAPPFDRYYCITTGWLNRPLAAAGLFRGLERCVSFLSGATPREDDSASV